MPTKIQYVQLAIDPRVTPLLADELADFDQLKDATSAAEKEFNRLKALLDAKRDRIVAEAHALDQTAAGFELTNPALDRPLRVSWVSTERVDVKRLAAERPEIAAAFLAKGGYWMIKRA